MSLRVSLTDQTVSFGMFFFEVLLITFWFGVILPWVWRLRNKDFANKLKTENILLSYRLVTVWMLFAALAHYGLHFYYESLLFWGLVLILVFTVINTVLIQIGKFQAWLVHDYSILIICIFAMFAVVAFVPNFFKDLSRATYADVRTLDYTHYPRQSKTMIVKVTDHGEILIVTNEFYHRSYPEPAPMEPSRPFTMTEIESMDKQSDVMPCIASGSIVKVGDEYFLLTNYHVLLAARRELEAKSILDRRNDIGIISLKHTHLLGVIPDQVSLNLSSMTNMDLGERSFFSVGLAQDHHYVINVGQAYFFPEKWNNLSDLFCFKVREVTDPKYHLLLQGKSGSPVVDLETGDQVGVFSSELEKIGGFDDLNCHVFTGIDQIKANLSRLLRREQ